MQIKKVAKKSLSQNKSKIVFLFLASTEILFHIFVPQLQEQIL